jgi:hypothetical protein
MDRQDGDFEGRSAGNVGKSVIVTDGFSCLSKEAIWLFEGGWISASLGVRVRIQPLMAEEPYICHPRTK